MTATKWGERAKEAAKARSASQTANRNKPSPTAEADASAKRPKPIAPPAGRVAAYFDSMSGGIFLANSVGEFQRYPDKAFSYELRRAGYHRDEFHDNGLSYLEEETLRVIKEQSVHFAGPVGGFDSGVYEMMGSRILVTRGPKWIEPKPGEWPTLRDFFLQLLGDQARYVFAWIKWALDSIRRGLPWSPGQMLAVAGPPGSGKSLFQSLLTPILGGRVSNPYAYMTEGTRFNCDIFGAEHALIGDQNHAIDSRSRRNFGAAIKNLVVNKEQRVEGKNKSAATLCPFLRVSITLNDNPESLLVLPPLDSDVADKLILLHARPVQFPWPSKNFADSQAYYLRLVQELPSFLFHLRRWRIPDSISCKRYGVTSYLCPSLVHEVEKLSPERKLLEAIDLYLFGGGVPDHWEGTSAELERELERSMKPVAYSKLFPFSTACGVYLAKLEKQYPAKIQSREAGGRKRIYMIHREASE